MESGDASLSLGQLMSRGAVAGLCLAIFATGPSLLSTGFAVIQVMMAVPLIVAFMLLGAGLSTLTLLD